ncbi:hypothetical protein GSI_09525 [Ganoderma sinense ZZ0214-1]|uniref:Uncharacterized protein n=1 Tax=Ganoderma sinense ZZ0214-1 TaxID=1077348 RepID=A0A2G8S3R3_9APHY|nr:hypothetical protein GSI_09525 [Ganoderma sinense ZZ0214-1]
MPDTRFALNHINPPPRADMCSSTTSTPSEQHSISPIAMSSDALTRPVTRTETLGAGLVSVRVNESNCPLFGSTATSTGSPEQRKRPREDEEENPESPKRPCLSQELGGEEYEDHKDKENSDPAGVSSLLTVLDAVAERLSLEDSAPTPSVAASPLGPSHTTNTGPPTTNPPVDPHPMCKSARSKPVLAKESFKGILRPQPFRRFPTTKNAERVVLRNNLRDIYLGNKARPTNVRYARDAPPRPRPRGTHSSNAAHRGPLTQPLPQKKYQYRFLSDTYHARLGLPPGGPVDPALFLGARPERGSPYADSDWTKDTEMSENGLELSPGRPLRARGQPVRIPCFRIASKRPGFRWHAPILPSPVAREDWARMEMAWRALLRKRKEELKARGARKGPGKPASRGRGPGGKPGPVPPIPVVRSKLGEELWRWSVEGSRGDEGDTNGVEVNEG